eukprot:CCRYP_018827-RA/>CCRYP_018827-RA protein AED:0.31 eAED:0.31 QI:15/1/1/1/0/0/2/83/126
MGSVGLRYNVEEGQRREGLQQEVVRLCWVTAGAREHVNNSLVIIVLLSSSSAASGSYSDLVKLGLAQSILSYCDFWWAMKSGGFACLQSASIKSHVNKSGEHPTSVGSETFKSFQRSLYIRMVLTS